MSWYLKVLSQYAQFNGRARRKEYWFYALFNFIVSLLLTLIGRLIHLNWLDYLYGLLVFIPTLAVTVRRLHDTGRRGWWILIELIPIIGTIILLIFVCLDSQPGTNKYGPNPKESD
jgi:uncharacterized membrane protein YhaH (DUF805 family)